MWSAVEVTVLPVDKVKMYSFITIIYGFSLNRCKVTFNEINALNLNVHVWTYVYVHVHSLYNISDLSYLLNYNMESVWPLPSHLL